MQKLKAFLLIGAGALALAAGVHAFAGQNAFAPDWPYPESMDEVHAAPNIHRVRYEDEHVRLVEVTILPGQTEPMHGHAFASVFARDAIRPEKLSNKALDPNSPQNGQDEMVGPAPQGMTWPTCSTMGPQAPHAVTNNDTFPLHFYRLEFKRIDGDGIRTRWKEWYPWMLAPLKAAKDLDPKVGAPFSKEFPYPIALDSYKAAPNNHQLRYEDSHIRFLEVTIRPGERENLHGHPYPSVFANDNAGVMPDVVYAPHRDAGLGAGLKAGAPGTENIPSDIAYDPSSPMNGQNQGHGPPPKGRMWPVCSTMGPQAPHQAFDGRSFPAHFYRIEFKRIDGDGIKTHWKEWYPWMTQN